MQERRNELAPEPRRGRAHWGRVHIEADRRRPMPAEEARRKR